MGGGSCGGGKEYNGDIWQDPLGLNSAALILKAETLSALNLMAADPVAFESEWVASDYASEESLATG